METSVLLKINGLDKSRDAFNSLSKNLDKVKHGTTGLRSKIEDMQPAFQKMAVSGGIAFSGIVLTAKKSIDAYAEVERAQRQLNNAVIGVSKGTAEQVQQINALTAALEKKAGVDADALTMGVAQLSTFGLSTDAVINLTKSLADLTVNQDGLNAGSEQYISNANVIAKALNGQFGILEKSGIRFTEAQKSIIEFGTESEKVAAISEGLAQNLRETTDTVNGLDLATAKQARSMENISEAIGKSLAPAFIQLAETITPLIEKFAGWAEQNPELLSRILLLAGAMAGLVTVLGAVGIALIALNPISVIIIGAIVAISSVIYGLNNLLKSFGLTWKQLWEAIKIATTEAVDFITSATLDPLIAKLNKVLNILSKVKDGIKNIGGKVGNAVSSVTDFTKDFFSNITPFANGGIVTGPTLGLVGEAGPEAIIPLSKAGALGGITINITGNTLLDQASAVKMGDYIVKALKMSRQM